MMPMGCWGMSTRSSFMSLPTYLLARCTARRTQSVQKMCSPYTANPKGWTGSDFRITWGHSTFAVTGIAQASCPDSTPLQPAPGTRGPGPALGPLDTVIEWAGPTEASCHLSHLIDKGKQAWEVRIAQGTQLSGNVRAWMGPLMVGLAVASMWPPFLLLCA